MWEEIVRWLLAGAIVVGSLCGIVASYVIAIALGDAGRRKGEP